MQIVKLFLRFIIIFQMSFVNTSFASEEDIAQEQGFIVLAFQMSQCQTEQGRWKQGIITVEVPSELETAASPDIDCTELLQLQMSVLEQDVDKEEYFQCATQDWAIEDSLPLAKNLVLKLNKVYNCPGEKQDFMDCAEDIGCNIMKSLPISKAAMKAVEYFSDGKYKQCQNSTDTNCLSEVFYGIVKNLTTNIGGIVDGAVWVKDKLCFWCETEEVENASSESMHMASTQEDGFFDRFMEDPYDATIGAIGRLFSGLGSMIQEGIENNFGCAKWAEPRYTSMYGNEPKCEEPIISWDCASCSQKLNMACGVVGFMGGEVVMALLTGGVANVASKVGKAIGASGVIAKVAEKAAPLADKVSNGFDKLGKIQGASPMSSINGWGIVKAGDKFAFKVGNRLIPLNDKTLALLRGTGGAAKGAIDLALWTPKKYLQLLEEAFILGQRGPKGLALYQASKLGDKAEKAARAAEYASKYPGKEGLALEKLEKQVGTLQDQYVAKVQQLMSKKPLSAADEIELKRIEDQIDKAKVAASRMKSNLDKVAKTKTEPVTEQVRSNSRLSDSERKNKAKQEIKANNPRMSQEEAEEIVRKRSEKVSSNVEVSRTLTDRARNNANLSDQQRKNKVSKLLKQRNPKIKNKQLKESTQAVMDAHEKFPCEVGRCTTQQLAGKIEIMKAAGIPKDMYRKFLKEGFAGYSQRPSIAEIGTPVKVTRSNGGHSNAQVTDYDPLTNEATVSFIENGVILQKRVNAGTLQPRTIDAGDVNIELGIRRTGNPEYSISRQAQQLSSSTPRNMEQARNVAGTTRPKPQLGDSVQGSYHNGNEFEGKLIGIDRENKTITVEVDLGNGNKVQQVVGGNQIRTLAKVDTSVRTPTSNSTIPAQKPVIEQPVVSPQRIKEDVPVVQTSPGVSDDVIKRAEAKLPADLKDHFRGLDPEAQRLMAQKVDGLSDQGREGLYNFVRQEIKANQPVVNVKPVRMLNDDQEQLVVYSVDEYMAKQERYNKLKRNLREEPTVDRAWRESKVASLKQEMREMREKLRSEHGQDVGDEFSERVNERMQKTRLSNSEQRLVKNKAQMEMNERISQTADEMPDDLKAYYRSLGPAKQNEIAGQLAGQTDSWKEGYYNLQRQQMSVVNAEKSRKVVETRGDPKNLNFNSVKLEKELKSLGESLNSASRSGRADVYTTPGQTGRNIRTDSGEIVPVHTTNQEYRSMASELVEKGSDFARPHSVSRMETDMASSNLSRNELSIMHERFGELPGETGLTSAQAMEKAVKFIEKIPQGQRTQAQSYILDKSKKYSQYFRLSQAQKKFKEASKITDNEKRLEYSEKAWKYAEDYLPPEVLEKLKKTLKSTQMPFGL